MVSSVPLNPSTCPPTTISILKLDWINICMVRISTFSSSRSTAWFTCSALNSALARFQLMCSRESRLHPEPTATFFITSRMIAWYVAATSMSSRCRISLTLFHQIRSDPTWGMFCEWDESRVDGDYFLFSARERWSPLGNRFSMDNIFRTCSF